MDTRLPFDAPVPPPASPLAKASAMAQVEAHADQDWLEAAYRALVAVANEQETLTTDDVWNELRARGDAVSTHDLRAIGPVMNRGRRDGLIEATDRIASSALGGGRWTVRVWSSRRCRGVA